MPAFLSCQKNRGEQQNQANTVRVGGESDFLDDQRTPGVQQHVARRRKPQQQGDHRQIRDDQEQLHHFQAARTQPVSEQEHKLGNRCVDGLQIRIVDLTQNGLESRRHRRIDEERFGGRAIRRARCGESVTVPEIAEKIVFEQRTPEKPAKPEYESPEKQPAYGNRPVLAHRVQIEPEYRQPRPRDQCEKPPEVRFTGRTRQ